MTYDQADYLRIPLLDGGFGAAQIFEIPKARAGEVFLGIATRRTDQDGPIKPFTLSEVIAVALTTDAPITSGQWTIGGFDQIPKFRSFFDYDVQEQDDFPINPVHDPAVIEAFVNAVHGLYPWDSFGQLFENMKRAEIERPSLEDRGSSA